MMPKFTDLLTNTQLEVSKEKVHKPEFGAVAAMQV